MGSARSLVKGERCWILALLLVAAWTFFGGTGTALAADDPAAKVVELTNLERSRDGLLPMKWNDTLGRAAAEYASVMAQGNFLRTATSEQRSGTAHRARIAAQHRRRQVGYGAAATRRQCVAPLLDTRGRLMRRTAQGDSTAH